MHPLREEPTQEDRLGFEPYVRAVAQIVKAAGEDDLPFTVGIFGHWGAGKTSFMKQLEQDLLRADGIETVWFYAWKYDRKDIIWNALVQVVARELQNRLPQAESDSGSIEGVIQTIGNFRDRMTRLASLALPTLVTAAGAAAGAGVDPIAGAAIGTLAGSVSKEVGARQEPSCPEKLSVDRYQLIETLPDEFRTLVQDYLEASSKSRLVVFIDDLDRCLPENVVLILEALKLFLDEAKKCIFILGVDRTVVEAAIANHYGGEVGFGRQYLDKIVQIGIAVSPATRQSVRAFFGPAVKELGISDEDEPLIGLAAQSNPRIYQRILNNWRLVKLLADENGKLAEDPMAGARLLLATSIHVRFPSLYSAARSNPVGLNQMWNYVKENRSMDEQTFNQYGIGAFWESFNDSGVHQYIQEVRRTLGDQRDPMNLAATPDALQAAFTLQEVLST